MTSAVPTATTSAPGGQRLLRLVSLLVAGGLAAAGLTAQPAQAADTGSITGKVFTQAVGGTKTPAAGGYIYLYRWDPADERFASVDADPSDEGTDAYSFTGSTYTLPNLPAGSYTFEVFAWSDYQGEYYNDAFDVTDATTLQVAAGATAAADVVLEPSGQITGRVTDSAGRPLANSWVMFKRSEMAGGTLVQTDSNGVYTSAGMRGGGLVKGDYRVEASNWGSGGNPDSPSYEPRYWKASATFAGATWVTVKPGLPTPGIDISLDQAPRVRLTVKDPAGNPLPNADVGVWMFYDGKWGPRLAGPNETDDTGVYRQTVRIGDRYKFFIKPPAGVDGITEWYDNAYTEATAKEISASAPGQVLDLTIQLGPAPAVTGTTPTIAGTARSGQTLTLSPGTWGPAGVAVARQWRANGVAIPGATGSTLRLTNAQAGKRITATVTGSIPGSGPVARTSVATATVQGVLTATKVSISGTTKVGKTLRAKTGSWGPAPVASSYKWYRNGRSISGQTKSTYKLRKADVGKRITVRVTQKKSSYASVSRLSSKTGKIKKK